MNCRNIILSALLPLALLTPPSALADEDRIGEMAEIMLHISHTASAKEQRELREIIGAAKASAVERSLATAILNIKHQAGPEDAARLRAIAEDESAPPQARELAGIILRFDHKASDVDKQQLRKLTR